MKILCLSDLHGYLPDYLPESDLILLAGDICPINNHDMAYQSAWLSTKFYNWMYDLRLLTKLYYTAGNHDFIFQSKTLIEPKVLNNYVKDQLITYRDLKIWFSPWSVSFGPWAFMCSEDKLRDLYYNIPIETDILVSHSPPYGACDKVDDGWHVGSKALNETILRVKPKVVICGHIHEGYGIENLYGIKIVNCSIIDSVFNVSNEPIIIEL